MAVVASVAADGGGASGGGGGAAAAGGAGGKARGGGGGAPRHRASAASAADVGSAKPVNQRGEAARACAAAAAPGARPNASVSSPFASDGSSPLRAAELVGDPAPAADARSAALFARRCVTNISGVSSCNKKRANLRVVRRQLLAARAVGAAKLRQRVWLAAFLSSGVSAERRRRMQSDVFVRSLARQRPRQRRA